MKKIFTKFAPLAVAMTLCASSAFATPVFSDLSENHWAYSQIMNLAENKVVVGYPDETYKPDAEITRAEFASMVVKALKQENAEITETIDFSDVKQDNWAWESVQRAVRFDLIHETEDNLFRPDDKVTKADCLEIVINSLTTEEMTLTAAKENLSEKYLDTENISEDVLIKIAKAEKLNLVTKNPADEKTTLAAKPATRAEIAVYLYNMMEQVRLTPNKKIEEVLQPIEADGIVIEDAIVKDNIGIIPAGTILPLIMKTELNSQTSVVTDVFEAKVPKNLVTSQKYLLIKEGATVKGLLIDKKKALLIIRNGKLFLNTKNITTSNNQTATFCAVAETDPKLSIWRKIFKGLKVKYNEDEVISVKLIKREGGTDRRTMSAVGTARAEDHFSIDAK